MEESMRLMSVVNVIFMYSAPERGRDEEKRFAFVSQSTIGNLLFKNNDNDDNINCISPTVTDL